MKTRKITIRQSLMLAMAAILLCAESGRTMEAADAPDTVVINSLAHLYSGVDFNHGLHTEVATCEQCHHHTTGGEVIDPNCRRCHANSGATASVSCMECHSSDRFSKDDLSKLDNPQLYHIDKPGLKGAYHLNCVPCHQQMGGPINCQDCHALTEAGEKMFQTGRQARAETAGSENKGH